MQAVILAGGKGTRLAGRLNGRPKPLIEVDGVPLLERQIRALTSQGVTHVVLLVNHAADQIAKFIADRAFDCRVDLVDDGDPRGTAGATLACLDMLAEEFCVIYGDTLFDIDLPHMIKAHRRVSADVTLFLHPNDHPADSDLVEVDGAGWINAFHPYPHPPQAYLRNLVNAAFYVVRKECLAPWTDRMPKGDFAKDLFPAMVGEGARLHGYVSFEYIKDAGTPERLDKAEGHLRSGVVARARRNCRQKAVFVDRDGTLNKLKGHIARAEDLELFAGVGEAIRRLNSAEFRVVLVTNQPVLARGECTEQELRRIHAKLETELGYHGAYLDGLYFCPHHPHKGYAGEVLELKRECACRKPGTAMIDAACQAMNIDPARSWMIGDSTADLELAARTGLRSVLVESGEGGRDGKWQAAPHATCTDVIAAVDYVLAASGPADAEQIEGRTSF